jgi:murein DD-endopeptidase MepM/ murein hydrolase activator NlpD
MLAIGNSMVGIRAPGPALAADPISDAKARQQQLQETLRQQETQLAELRTTATSLDQALSAAEAELSEISAEYERIFGLLTQVTEQIAEIEAQIADLRQQIDELDAQLQVIAAEIGEQTERLHAREALLQDHLRSAYERSQVTILEILLTADSLEVASNQVGYLLTMSEQDRELADEVRDLREELRERRQVLSDGRRALAQAQDAAEEQQTALEARQADLAAMEVRLAELKVAADQRRAEQEALLNTTLAEQGNLEQSYAKNAAAAEAQASLVQRLIAEEEERQRKIEEARRLEAERRAREEAEAQRRAEEAARLAAAAEAQRRAAEAEAQRQADVQRQADAQRQADEAARQAAEAEARRQAEEEARRAAERISSSGFRWPAARFRITQEFGPTSFALEPPYTYRGTWYRHFHTGIDMANGCGTPVMAAREGVVVSSGQPLAPYDSAYGVIIGHGDGIYTWYWHLQPRVIVWPGNVVTTGQVIGYEGTTGFSTGCHLHFAIHVNGSFENPRFFLP